MVTGSEAHGSEDGCENSDGDNDVMSDSNIKDGVTMEKTDQRWAQKSAQQGGIQPKQLLMMSRG